MRIGVFGGTFDPIHVGHLRSAEEVRIRGHLDRVLFVPNRVPPHKKGAHHTPFAHRWAMLTLAVSAHPGFEACDFEGKRAGASYTIETLKSLRRHRDASSDLVLIMGSDAFAEFSTWKHYRQIPKLVDMLVMSRPHNGRPAAPIIPLELQSTYRYDPKQHAHMTRNGRSLQFVKVTSLDVSARHIRQLSRSGESIRYLVPEPVLEYIKENHLYR